MKDLFGQNYYELLEVSPASAPHALRQAIDRTRDFWADESGPSYSLLAPEEREQLLARIAEAAKILLDPETRRRYHEEIGLPAIASEAPPPVPAPARPSMPSPPPAPGASAAEASRKAFPTPTRRPLPSLKANLRPFKTPLVARPTQEIRPPAAVSKPLRPGTPPPAPVPPPAPAVPEPPRQRPDPAEFFPAESDCTGENLKRYREACGIDLVQIARQTRISRMHLENVEAGRFDLLPAPVYVRGFLEAYCKQLGLDPALVTTGYLRKLSTYKRIEGQE